MKIRKVLTLLALTALSLALVMAVPHGAIGLLHTGSAAAAPAPPSKCVPVGGMLMTNIQVVNGESNLGPATGDLAGSIVAAPSPVHSGSVISGSPRPATPSISKTPC